MAISSWSLVHVHATWTDHQGDRLPGAYRVRVPTRLTNSADDIIIPAGVWATGNLSVAPNSQSLSIMCPSTDDPDIQQDGWKLEVEVSFTNGQLGEKYVIEVPVANRPIVDGGNGLGVNLRTIAITAQLPPQAAMYGVGRPNGLALLSGDGTTVLDANGDPIETTATWDALADKPAVIAAGSDADAARASIDAITAADVPPMVGEVKPEAFDPQAGVAGHDCTAALQAAIAASEQSGLTVVLAADRTYDISAALITGTTLPVRIKGHPTAWIRAMPGFTGTSMLHQSPAAEMIEGISLVDVNLNGALNAPRCLTIHRAHHCFVEGGWWKNATSEVAHFGGTHVYEAVVRRTRISGIQPNPSQGPELMPPYGLVWDANDSHLTEIVSNNSQECVTISRGGNVVSGMHVFGYPYRTTTESRDFLATVGIRVSGESNTLKGSYLDCQRTGLLVTGRNNIVTDTRNYIAPDWTPVLSQPVRVIDIANDLGASGRVAGVVTSPIPAGITVGGSVCHVRSNVNATLDISGVVPDQSGAGGVWASGGPGPLALHVASRMDGLVTNGSGTLGSNYNWSNFSTVRSDHPTGASASFESTSAAVVTLDEAIPVSPSRYYDLSHHIKQQVGDGARRFYSFLQPFDIDGLAITPGSYMEQAGTRTTLAAPLAVGNTTITLTSAAGWNNAAGASTHLRTIIFWAYVDGTGYAWPAGTYSRILRSNAYADGGISGNVITLTSPWTGPALPAGTPVSNGSSGGSYLYGAQNILAPSSWTGYGPYRFGGIHTDLTAAATTAFPIPTATVKIGFLLNQGVADPTARARVTNVTLRPALGRKPAVTGSRGGNAALTSLLAALAELNVISDSTGA